MFGIFFSLHITHPSISLHATGMMSAHCQLMWPFWNVPDRWGHIWSVGDVIIFGFISLACLARGRFSFNCKLHVTKRANCVCMTNFTISVKISPETSSVHITVTSVICRQSKGRIQCGFNCSSSAIQYTRSVWKVSVLIFLWTNLKCSTLLRHTSA
jgi:hypothetical protein